jgi:hemin uptake protein HemP
MRSPAEPSNREPARAAPNRDERPRHCSEALLGGAREVVIEHRGQDYFLRLTSSGKLILTK